MPIKIRINSQSKKKKKNRIIFLREKKNALIKNSNISIDWSKSERLKLAKFWSLNKEIWRVGIRGEGSLKRGHVGVGEKSKWKKIAEFTHHGPKGVCLEVSWLVNI